MPREPFLLAALAHTHNVQSTGDANEFHRAEEGGGGDRTIGTSESGGHVHTISGGDAETRPKNLGVYYYIRIN